MNPATGVGDRVAVLVMAYGTPRHRDEILPYYTDIRRGRPPSDEQLADLAARYAAIGGLSPLAQLTEDQRDAVGRALDRLAPGAYEMALGLKHAEPRIESAVEQIAARGLRRVVALVLAPHYSVASVGQYLERTRVAAAPHGIAVVGIESWATEPALVEFLAEDLRARLDALPAATRVVFTAHSLPQRVAAAGDPYPDELRSTAVAVAARLGIPEQPGGPGPSWSLAWQSAGRTPEPWLGPDILTVIDELGDDDSVEAVVVCACGFVADHLEVLYDLDIEAAGRATARGLRFDRTAGVNADPRVMAALAARVHAAARR